MSVSGWWTAGPRGAASGAISRPRRAAYAERIEALTGVPVEYAGTGPSRLALARRVRP